MKGRFFVVLLATILAGFGLFIVVVRLDPYQSGAETKFLFFGALFLFLWGLISLIGYLARVVFLRNFSYSDVFNTSFWQGLFFSFLITLAFILNRIL